MNKLIEYINENELGEYLENERLRYHTSVRLGGKARVVFMPKDVESLGRVVKYVRKNGIKHFILGRGSNIVFPDGELDIVVIKICRVLDFIEIDGCEIVVGAGYSLARLAKEASKLGLAGMEFAGGIPGTVGGSVYMNAGAHTGDMASVLEKVVAIDSEGHVVSLTNEECKFTYRHSIFQDNDFIIVSTMFKLVPGDSAAVYKKMAGNLAYRREMQPLDLPSVGSTFRNPEGHHAGKLIEECGLKGFKIGGACVSEKHANFVVNMDEATSSDFIALVELIKKTVLDKKGVVLETEFVKVEI